MSITEVAMPELPPGAPLLTIDEAAIYLAIPKFTLYTLRTRRAGFGPPAVKIGGSLRFRRCDLDTWINAHVEQPGSSTANDPPKCPRAGWARQGAVVQRWPGNDPPAPRPDLRGRPNMARPSTPLGIWGAAYTLKVRRGEYRARARVCDHDGRSGLVSATGTTRAAAERLLQELLVDRVAPTGDDITAEVRLAKPAELWLTFLRADDRIEQSTINEYERMLSTVVLPQLGGLRIREATTGRLDRFDLEVRKRSENRQRMAKVVLGAILDMAVRHDAVALRGLRWCRQ